MQQPRGACAPAGLLFPPKKLLIVYAFYQSLDKPKSGSFYSLSQLA